MLKIPYFGVEKLRLSFEYGLTISRVAHQHNIELTTEIVQRAEKILENEFRNQTATFLAVNMVPIILSVFELDISK